MIYEKNRIQNYPKKTFNTTNKIAPGIPKKPIIIDVPIFNPIWKLKKVPTKLIIKIIRPPKNELPIIFKINFKGNIKNLPIINKKIIQPK